MPQRSTSARLFATVVDGALTHMAVLRFLRTAAFLFGIAATLTGAMFLVNDQS